MAYNEDDVINEPKLDASNCSFFSETSDEIKFHYKLKYPGSYSIPSRKILDLLDNDILVSHLKSSVKTFVRHAREIHKINKSLSSIVTPASIDTGSIVPSASTYMEVAECNKNLNTLVSKSEETATKKDDVFEISPTSDISLYDSVHSIKIPWRSYKNVNLKNSKRTFFRRKKPEYKGSQLVTGLVFERVEKSVPLPLKYKAISPSTQNCGFSQLDNQQIDIDEEQTSKTLPS